MVAADYFLKLEYSPTSSLIGGSEDPVHFGWMEILSYAVMGTGGRSVGVSPPDPKLPQTVESIHIGKRVDRASVALASAAATGQVFSRAVIDVVQPDRQGYWFELLGHVVVMSYQFGGSAGRDDHPVESFELGLYQSMAFHRGAYVPGARVAATVAQAALATTSQAIAALRRLAAK